MKGIDGGIKVLDNRNHIGLMLCFGHQCTAGIYGIKKKLPWVNPANMIKADVDIPFEILKSNQSLEVIIND